MTTKKTRIFTVLRVAVFIVLPVLLGLLMFWRTSEMLMSYMETRVANEAQFLSEMVSQHITAQKKDLEQVADYFRDERIAEEDMIAPVEQLLEDPSRISCGILRLDGSAVAGGALQPGEYPAVRKAFHGKSTVRYRSGENFLFTTPIYNGDNIKYVLYEFMDRASLFHSLDKIMFGGNGTIALADSSQQIVIAFDEEDDISVFEDARTWNMYSELKREMGVKTTNAVYYSDGGVPQFRFIAEIGQGNLYLIGMIPYETVAEGIYSITIMVFVVFTLLIILLSIGTANVMSATAKARESDELRQAKIEVEKASKSKSAFLANMSHELRTPINVILGMDEMILREENDPETRERAMDIRSASHILMSLINDILDFSKIEAGSMNIINADYSLPNVIRDLNLLTENRARQKSLKFDMDIQSDLPIGLYGDDFHIRQVLTNLLTNAVKYTPEGSVALKLSGRKKDDKIVLKWVVSDTGIGIKQEDIDKLMIPYTRVDESRNRNIEGTGLGMSIIINLLKLMDSRLHIESVYGEGSTFWFEIEQRIVDHEPVGDIEKRLDDMVKDYEYRVSFIAPGARILMVDDNSMNRNIFASLLKKTQISVTTVSSGAKCLEIIQREHFDMIFMDHLMPEMDGIETLNRMKAQENNLCKNTPVIALTANAFAGDREKYKSLGFDDFMSKPVSSEKLEKLIRDMLPPKYIKEAPAETSEKVESHRELPQADGVNREFAQLHIKDDDLFVKSVKDFYRSIDFEYNDILELSEKALEDEEALKNYRIRVHALKSSSALVGIMSVSELAKLLEYAARDKELSKIKMLNPVLLEELLKMKDRLRIFVGQSENKTPMKDREKLAEMLESLRKAIDAMNIGAADSVTEQLEKFSFKPDLQEFIDKLCKDVAALDYDAAAKDIDDALEANG